MYCMSPSVVMYIYRNIGEKEELESKRVSMCVTCGRSVLLNVHCSVVLNQVEPLSDNYREFVFVL